MSMPLRLLKNENEITEALATANIKLNSRITNYHKEALDVEYRLSSTQMPLPCIVMQAEEITEKHISNWKSAFPHLR
jgi:hypothetical protein